LTTDRQSLRAALREKFPRNHGQLLPALHYLQHEFGHLPDWAMETVGWHLGIPASEVYGAATSYTELRVQQPGEHILRVCTGLACSVNGARRLMADAESRLGAHPGSPASNGKVTFEAAPCGYLCGIAPAIELDGRWQGRVTPEKMRTILDEVTA
jgi:NADH:ubiquinone oxidoreductase subunit E